MNEEELLQLANNLIKMGKYCDTITTGNLPHRIANLKQAIINTADYIKAKIEKQ